MKNELLIAWLNDAYAMEQALIPVLENHAKDAKDNPTARARIELHAEQTRRHGELVKGCLEQLSESPSTVKSVVGTLFGAVHSVSTGMFSDEAVKNALADYATEHFEMACYRALSEAARAVGNQHIVQVCGEIVRDEQEMADWLSGQLPAIVREGLAKSAAKR
ncbi:MAG: ferritin-like domain-containing protein [Gemmatimonadaceae bacterium]